MLTTLEQFMANKRLINAYIGHPDFDNLYVRKGPRYIHRVLHQKVFDIANVTAIEMGKGAFTDFIKKFRQSFPDYTIYVESVVNDRFGVYLLRQGFQSEEGRLPPSYFLLAKEPTFQG